MSDSALSRLLRVEFAPPRYLSMPAAGIDLSSSGIKVAVLKDHVHGLELATFGEARLSSGAITGGEITDRPAVIAALRTLAKEHAIRFANIALPESRGYPFETEAEGTAPAEWRAAVEGHLDEFVPLPSKDVAFDIAAIRTKRDRAQVVGIGYARRVVDETLSVFDEAGIEVRSLEGETYSEPRALLQHGNQETVLIIDIGRTTTKLVIVSCRLPRFATTLDIGGHALTLAVQKHFGVTEEEAKRVKAERGLVSGEANDEYVAAMLSTVSVIREEITRRLDYWQALTKSSAIHDPVTRAILVGGNGTVRGLSEYLETSLKVPVELGDVFTNLASRDHWMPPLDYLESLAYSPAIGLALREHCP